MKEILRVILVLLVLTLSGAIGFSVIEGWSLFDGLYMAVITLTTVGYTEVHPLSDSGRLFAMIFLIVGLGVFMFGAVTLGEFVVRAQLGDWLGQKKMMSILNKMQDHFIVCGLGRLGRSLCEELEERSLPFIAIDSSEEIAEACKERNWPFLVGDATEDDVLRAAGIERARGIACTLPSDAENMFVVLSARLLRKDLLILSRATTEKDAIKLRRAGANRVISLYATGAAKMAQLLATPHVEDFFEVVTARGKAFELAELKVSDDAPYVDQPLSASGLRDRGVMVVGIRRRNGELSMPPKPSDVIRKGDLLFVLGKGEVVQELLN
ncbi:MAG: potassium channel protein [Planctomycetes bacterium]|nr:potassium channel protein [Planctomycetota bacterium]